MERKQGGLIPIGKALSGLGGPVKELREATPQALNHFTRFDQVNQLVMASEADPDLGFMVRLSVVAGKRLLIVVQQVPDDRFVFFSHIWYEILSAPLIEEVHKVWLALPAEDRPKHPLAPLVAAWQERPQTPAKSTVTTVEGMTRRLATISDARRVPWTDSYDLDAAIVDGEPIMTWITDPATLFQEGRTRRKRRLFKPGEGLPLKVDGLARPASRRVNPAQRGD